MVRNVFRNGPSLFQVVENSPIPHLKDFFLQADDNFRAILQTVEQAIATADDDEGVRSAISKALNQVVREQIEPVEVECRRILDLAETKGPTSLKSIVERRLDHEACEEFDDQPGDLAKSLWAHVRHRREFDDAVSYKAIRSWRNAGRLFAAFNVELEGKGEQFLSAEIDTERLATAIGKRLKTSRKLTFSVIDLPRVPEYLPSVLVIVRFAGQQTSVATHGEQGERRLLYFLPQDEAILIYTPADEKIEVAATRAAVRIAVAECFASETLGHDLSAKPLVASTYDTSRFLKSVDLPLPDITGFTVLYARVVELELRVENWNSRLGLKAAGEVSMDAMVERYLYPGGVLRRALGISRVMLMVDYHRQDEDGSKIMEILISDGNSCSLNSERDPVIRNFGRKLLEAWGVLRAFVDLDPGGAIDLVPVMAELWELDQKSQKGVYFSSRGILTKPLEDARLIRKKEIEPHLNEEDEDSEDQRPTISDRTIYSVDLVWLEERLIAALKSIMDVVGPEDVPRRTAFLGVLRIDERDVPCYLARGLDELKTFAAIDEHLRVRSGSGPGIVFTGRPSNPKLLGANVIIPLVSFERGVLTIGLDRAPIEVAFRTGRSLALGAGTLQLVEDGDRSAARLHFPDREPLDLFGSSSIRAFRLLVDAALKGAPGVRSGELINGSGSAGFQQMIGGTRWPVVETYVEKIEPRRWKLKGF